MLWQRLYIIILLSLFTSVRLFGSDHFLKELPSSPCCSDYSYSPSSVAMDENRCTRYACVNLLAPYIRQGPRIGIRVDGRLFVQARQEETLFQKRKRLACQPEDRELQVNRKTRKLKGFSLSMHTPWSTIPSEQVIDGTNSKYPLKKLLYSTQATGNPLFFAQHGEEQTAIHGTHLIGSLNTMKAEELKRKLAAGYRLVIERNPEYQPE